MHHLKGNICKVVPCSGCLEVTVAGVKPGIFVIDNCCAWAIVETEGLDWIGRPVEYQDGYLRFLKDQVETLEVSWLTSCSQAPPINSYS